MKVIKYGIVFIILISLVNISNAYIIIHAPVVSNITYEELDNFLNSDTTDMREYTTNYTCGYFARDLARNATTYNITLGGIIVSPGPSFMDHDNHIMNYIYVNGSIVYIEPQTDMTSEDLGYDYYILYPNGRSVPSKW